MKALYKKHIGHEPVDTLYNDILASAYDKRLPSKTHISRFISQRPQLVEKIKRRRGNSKLYSGWMILPLYHLIAFGGKAAVNKFPFPLDDLQPVLADLGMRE